MKKDITPCNEKGEPHGYWEEYFPNGQLMFKGNFVDGKQHGYLERYYTNGQLCYKGNYVNGERHGYWAWYHNSGQLELIIYFI
jgi:antitoxin component YwqK of YwqJK toxin-antitoxin module